MLQYVTNKNEVAYRGKDLKLWCIFGGTPLPTIKWTRIGQELPQDRIMHENYGENQNYCIYRSSAGSHFYGTEYEIWAGFGPVGNTEKKIGQL